MSRIGLSVIFRRALQSLMGISVEVSYVLFLTGAAIIVLLLIDKLVK